VLCVLGVWRGVAGGTITGTLACLGSTACYGATFANHHSQERELSTYPPVVMQARA
jgi:hypothetical protein